MDFKGEDGDGTESDADPQKPASDSIHRAVKDLDEALAAVPVPTTVSAVAENSPLGDGKSEDGWPSDDELAPLSAPAVPAASLVPAALSNPCTTTSPGVESSTCVIPPHSPALWPDLS